MEQQIENTFVTSLQLESVLQKALNTKCCVSKWSSKVLSAERGFLSIVIRIELEWSGNERESLPHSVVLKVPTTSKLEDMLKKVRSESTEPAKATEKETSDPYATVLIAVHNTECAFYQLQPPPQNTMKIPKVLFAKKITKEDPNGYIVMEDLSEVVADRHISDEVSLAAIFQLVDVIADLHAYSLTNSEWLLDSDLAFSGRRQSDRIHTVRDGVHHSIKVMAELAPALKKYVDRTAELYQFVDSRDIIYLPREEDHVPTVLCSGDIWMNNILWGKDSEGLPSDSLVAIVDFQCSHPGAVGEDLATLLISSTPREIRRKHLQDILDHYYLHLQEKLGKPPPFDMSQLQQSLRQSYLHSFFRLIEGYPIFMKMCGDNDAAKQVIIDRCQAVVEDAFAILDGKEFGSYSV